MTNKTLINDFLSLAAEIKLSNFDEKVLFFIENCSEVTEEQMIRLFHPLYIASFFKNNQLVLTDEFSKAFNNYISFNEENKDKMTFIQGMYPLFSQKWDNYKENLEEFHGELFKKWQPITENKTNKSITDVIKAFKTGDEYTSSLLSKKEVDDLKVSWSRAVSDEEMNLIKDSSFQRFFVASLLLYPDLFHQFLAYSNPDRIESIITNTLSRLSDDKIFLRFCDVIEEMPLSSSSFEALSSIFRDINKRNRDKGNLFFKSMVKNNFILTQPFTKWGISQDELSSYFESLMKANFSEIKELFEKKPMLKVIIVKDPTISELTLNIISNKGYFNNDNEFRSVFTMADFLVPLVSIGTNYKLIPGLQDLSEKNKKDLFSFVFKDKYNIYHSPIMLTYLLNNHLFSLNIKKDDLNMMIMAANELNTKKDFFEMLKKNYIAELIESKDFLIKNMSLKDYKELGLNISEINLEISVKEKDVFINLVAKRIGHVILRDFKSHMEHSNPIAQKISYFQVKKTDNGYMIRHNAGGDEKMSEAVSLSARKYFDQIKVMLDNTAGATHQEILAALSSDEIKDFIKKSSSKDFLSKPFPQFVLKVKLDLSIAEYNVDIRKKDKETVMKNFKMHLSASNEVTGFKKSLDEYLKIFKIIEDSKVLDSKSEDVAKYIINLVASKKDHPAKIIDGLTEEQSAKVYKSVKEFSDAHSSFIDYIDHGNMSYIKVKELKKDDHLFFDNIYLEVMSLASKDNSSLTDVMNSLSPYLDAAGNLFKGIKFAISAADVYKKLKENSAFKEFLEDKDSFSSINEVVFKRK